MNEDNVNLFTNLISNGNKGVKMLTLLNIFILILSMGLIIYSNAYMYYYVTFYEKDLSLPIIYSIFVLMLLVTSILTFVNKMNMKILLGLTSFYILFVMILNSVFASVYVTNPLDFVNHIYITQTIGIFLIIVSFFINIFMYRTIFDHKLYPN